MLRWSLFVPALAAVLALFGGQQPAQAQDQAPTLVVELFTSQGCNSCPPADAYLLELTERQEPDNLIVLGYHIDYWDYLGWSDTFATPQTTARQRGYMRALRLQSVYTPQMVVGGRIEAIGADRKAVEAAIQQARATVPNGGAKLAFVYRESGYFLTVEPMRAGDSTRFEGAEISLVLFADRQDIAIGRGENAGKTVAYANIVRAMIPLAKWDGRPAEYALPTGTLAPDAKYCAAIVQMPNHGAILGAVKATIVNGGW